MRTDLLIKTRRAVVYALSVALTIEIIGGLALFLPELGFEVGDIIYSTLSHRDWRTIHELVTYVLIPLGTLHIALNWKTIKQYPKTILKKPLRKIVGLSLISIGGFSAITGLLIRFYFVGGGGSGGHGRGRPITEPITTSITLFGLTREDVIFWHEYISLGIIVLIAIHIFLNRKILKFYFFGPKKSVRQAKTKIPYFDLMKIKHVLLIHNSGVPMFYSSLGEDKLNAELLSGLISALTNISKEILRTNKRSEYTIHDYNELKVFLIHGNYTMLGLVCNGKLSEKFIKALHKELLKVEKAHLNELVNWTGDLEIGTNIIKDLEKAIKLFTVNSEILDVRDSKDLQEIKKKISLLKKKYSKLTVAT